MLNNNKTKLIIASFAVIASMGLFTNMDVISTISVDANELSSRNSIPRPPSYTMGDYGNSISIDHIASEASVKDPPQNSALKLSEIKKNNYGLITVVYLDDSISYTSNTTMPEFLKKGGILALHSEIGNLDVEKRIANYEKSHPGQTFVINGDPAKGSEKNPDLEIPAQLTIYQSNGEQVQLLSWGSLDDLVEFAKNLQ
ncbi:hypothetical protein [Nitrosopumilus sp.]|uniref:hypothetical protein n=1 Tax=Nitrosopumilus sp. TaxID=2024843 RepID=UPI0034A034DD